MSVNLEPTKGVLFRKQLGGGHGSCHPLKNA